MRVDGERFVGILGVVDATGGRAGDIIPNRGERLLVKCSTEEQLCKDFIDEEKVLDV